MWKWYMKSLYSNTQKNNKLLISLKCGLWWWIIHETRGNGCVDSFGTTIIASTILWKFSTSHCLFTRLKNNFSWKNKWVNQQISYCTIPAFPNFHQLYNEITLSNAKNSVRCIRLFKDIIFKLLFFLNFKLETKNTEK